LRPCRPVAEIKVDGKSTDAKVVAESLLMNLAVIDSGRPSAHFIPWRIGTSFDLGEAVTNVGFPLCRGRRARLKICGAAGRVPLLLRSCGTRSGALT
jgi:hypothetical protein